MLSLAESAAAALFAFASLLGPRVEHPDASDGAERRRADAARVSAVAPAPTRAGTPQPTLTHPTLTHPTLTHPMPGHRHLASRPLAAPFADVSLPGDTIPRRRRPAVEYSEAYGRRVTLHRRLSYAMLPLFAASYLSGDRLFEKGRDAPAWARHTHRPAATGAAVLFGANTVTGAWNLWEGRGDPDGRTRRLVHAALFTAASAGFTYAGTSLAEAAERSGDKRRQHRAVNLASMGVATASWLLMLVDR